MKGQKLNERQCPCCGHKVWDKVETLTAQQIRGLYEVYKWAVTNKDVLKKHPIDTHKVRFKRKDIVKPLRRLGGSDFLSANFAKIRHDESVLTNYDGRKGYYQLDLVMTAKFFKGEMPIPAQFRVHSQWNHQPRRVSVLKKAYIADFPELYHFIEDKKFIAQYLDPYTKQPTPHLDGQENLF